MTRALEQSLKKFRKVDDVIEILGTLGAAIGGERFVEVPNRPPFVYVQLRNNQNELIQAFNDKVSPVYGLPVVVVRQGNRYVIKERDTQRYSDWQSYSPFLPRHGDQHSFNDMGGGGDVVWVYGKQFMPMLVTPSGSLGGPNVILDPYVIQTSTGGWLYAGATGTANIVQHKPTGSTAIMVLVYVNQNDGNPYLIINSGTHFNNILTGTSQIIPYLPSVTNSAWLPAFAVRLVSGTSTIGWDNLYDVRQYYHSIIPTGTTGGTSVNVQDEGVAQGSASTFNFVGAGVTASVAGGLATINIPGGGTSSGVYKNPGSVLFAGADGYPDEDNLRLYWDNTNHIFRVGPPSPSALLTSSTLNNQNVAVSQNTSATYAAVTYGTGTSGSPAPVFAGYRMRGTPSAPTVIADNDTLQLLVGAGYDGSNFINAARIRQSAWGDWSALGAIQGSKTEFEWIPSGTATRIIGASFRDQLFNVSGSVNIPANQTYNISGSPHTHNYQPAGTYITGSYTLLDGRYQPTGTAACDLLYDNELTATGTFDITNIPSTYKHLELRVYLRTNRVGTFESVSVKFNNDSGANYDYVTAQINSAGAGAGGDVMGATFALASYCAAASSAAGLFSTGIWFINNYAGTTGHKKMQCRSEDQEQNTTTNFWIYDISSRWASTSAINRITIVPGSGNSFVAGSRVSLYGYR